jgi:hypothetical protein
MQQVKSAPMRALVLFALLLSAASALAAAPAGTVPAPPGVPGTPAPASRAGASAGDVDHHVYTNADIEALEPIPQQAAPLVDTPGWDFVFQVLDRERAQEEKRRVREAEQRALSEETLERDQEETGTYFGGYYYPGWGYSYPGWGYSRPGGGHGGHNGHHRPGPVNVMPSNPYASLSARGIRTAEDLFLESVRNSTIRRSSYLPYQRSPGRH